MKQGAETLFQAPNGAFNYLIKRDGLLCQSCGIKMRFTPAQLKRAGLKDEAVLPYHQRWLQHPKWHHHPERATLDHIVPKAHGGTKSITNLRLVCGYCNSWRGTSPQLKRLEVKA